MFKNLKWLRLVPDRPGRGGQKTGFHSFQAQPINDTWLVSGFHVYRGRWRKDYATQNMAVFPDNGAGIVKAVHPYIYPSLTDPSANQNLTLLGHNFGGGSNRYWDYTNNTTRDTHAGGSVPATFLNIQGRCFVADGAREGMILDDRTPAIHAQRNQNLGIGTPIQPLQIVNTGTFLTQASGAAGNSNLSAVGTAYAYNGSLFVNTPNADSPIGALLVGDVVTPFILNTGYPYDAGAIAGMAGALAVNAVSSNVTPFTAAGTVSITTGTSLVTLAGATWPANFDYCGLAINFNGYSFVILEHGIQASAYNIDGTQTGWAGAPALSDVQLLIMGVYDGPTISAPGVPYTITGCQFIAGAASTLTMTNSAAGTLGYAQATVSNLVQLGIGATRAGLTLNLGNIAFDDTLDPALPNFTYQPGPKYAYAWYDPETGHMSNISPTTQIPAPTITVSPAGTALQHLTPYFQVGPGLISYPAGVDATRFSHIMFFRTLAVGGSTLYPIGSMMPYTGKVHPGTASTRGSWNPSTFHGWMGLPATYVDSPPPSTAMIWFDFSKDEDLLLTGGFRAPQYTNEKPMALLRGGVTQPAKIAHQAYWDRRLWAVCTQEPDKIMYSCDEAQCPLGVPVESFPPTNFLRIPSVDGQVLGMRTIGDMLLVTTERWAYTIAGNNESNYRLLRISTRMAGVGTYQMDEMTSDVEGQQSVVYFLGIDKIVYEWIPGGSVTPISAPVQNTLNSRITGASVYDTSRVHCVSAWARRLVVVSTTAPGGDSGKFLIFDVDNRVWTTHRNDNGATIWVNPPAAMTTIYGLDPPVNEVFAIMNSAGNQANVFSWIRDDGAVQLDYGMIFTFPLDFDGKKTRKQLVAVNLHVSDNAGGVWQCYAFVNEGISHAAQAIPYEDPLYSIYDSPLGLPADSPTQKDLVVLPARFGYDAIGDVSEPLVGYRFTIQVVSTVRTAPTELWAVDISYVDWEEPGEGDP